MADEIFENSKLVAIYDYFDGDRHDLDHYVTIAKYLRAASVVDVGCGTGTLANRLAAEGFVVTGVDPARESMSLLVGSPSPRTSNGSWVTQRAYLKVVTIWLL